MASRDGSASREKQYHGKTIDDINRSLAGHKTWRTQYRKSVEGRIQMVNIAPTPEAVEYLREEWKKYESKCWDIEAGSNLIIANDKERKYYEQMMTEIDTQAAEYTALSDKMIRALSQSIPTAAPRAAAPAAAAAAPTEPKIKKELMPDTLTKDTTPIEFRKFQREFTVYYKESNMDRASQEGQKHYLLKCLDAELAERLLAITNVNTPIFATPGNNDKSCFTHLQEEFQRRFPVTNRRKDFFLQSQGHHQFTAYMDKLQNMAVEADLGNASVEDLIVVMAVVGCKDDELRGDLQKLDRPNLEEVRALGEAFERKTFAEKGNAVRVAASSSSQSKSQGQNQPRQSQRQRRNNPNDDPQRRREIEKLMKGKCYRCGDNHDTTACSQKSQSLKCNLCNRKGHTAKACYTEMLKKTSTSANAQTASQSTPPVPALTYQPSSSDTATIPARMIRSEIVSGNASISAANVSPSEIKWAHPQSVVHVGGKTINLDEPPKDIPPLWM